MAPKAIGQGGMGTIYLATHRKNPALSVGTTPHPPTRRHSLAICKL
jgi:hypothetical protein